jgi:putative transcriptional regulator
MTIKWRLNVLMAERRLKNKDLTEVTGMHPVTISKLKNSQEVPERLERSTLEKLCTALKCQPGDLMSWEPDQEAPEIHQLTCQERQHSKQKGSSASELRRGLSTEKPPQTSKSETTVGYQEQEQ